MKLLYIDLFCGAGGTSTGVETASLDGEQCAKVIACVNHDMNAIASHAANHPDALHFTEDIRTLELSPLKIYVEKMKMIYPDAFIVLWASLECTNFSKAKGGQPRDADSRTLAEHMFRYIESIDPDYIHIENVEEFMSWGELDKHGKPVSRDKGTDYMKWTSNVCKYGYHTDLRILNSADFGAYTSRKRLFIQFAKHGLPISFPEPTHCKGGSVGMFQFKKWKAVKDVLDFTDEGESIFGRKTPLVEATLERIYAGLIKFVAGGKEEFLLKYNSMSQRRTYVAPGVDEPCPTISTQGRLNVVKCFLSKYYGGRPESKNSSINSPAGTITTKDHHSFISAYYGNGSNAHSVNEPCPTVTTKDRIAFLTTHYGNGYIRSIDDPAPTIKTKDIVSKTSVNFIDQQFGQSKPSSIKNPLGAITSNPKYNLVTCKPWIMNTNFNNVGSSINEPAQTITANRKWHYLLNPQYQSKGSSIDKPCFTLIARMDKTPPYLIEAQTGSSEIILDTADSEQMKKIKEFMFIYGIIDIKMRMLRIPELKMIMGFPKDYVLIGTQAEQKKYIGNAVEVTMARVLCEATASKLNKLNKIAI